MTQDEIIEIARQADEGFEGGAYADGTMPDSIVGIAAVIRFAKLVIEKCAAVCENTEIEGSLAYGSVCAEKLRSMGKTT